MRNPRLKFSSEVYKVIKGRFDACYLCGYRAEKRFGNKVKLIPGRSVRVSRTSKTSFTINCRACGLNYTITWKSLADALEEKVEIEKAKGRKKSRDILKALLAQLKIIKANTDTTGIERYNLKKAKAEANLMAHLKHSVKS